MTPEIEKILQHVAKEAVLVIPKWKLIDAAGYLIAAPSMFDEVFNGWNELKEQRKYDLGENSRLVISESLNSNNPVYLLVRKEQVEQVVDRREST